MSNILDYLEDSANRFPDKKAFIYKNTSITYKELYERSTEYGEKYSSILDGKTNKPICILADRGIDVLSYMFGCLYSGNFYVLIDSALPIARVSEMVASINPICVIGEDDIVKDLQAGNEFVCISYDKLSCVTTNKKYGKHLSYGLEPMYGVFTSGSTGVPKLVVKSHNSLMEFIDLFTKMFNIGSNDVFGNQFPFYFDASTKDIFCGLKCGATVHIIPKEYFSFPKELVKYLNEKCITTIIWVPSALVLVANMRALDGFNLDCIRNVFFVGEQMPIKQLNYWKACLEKTRFVNLYGATEVAGNFLYYVYSDVLDVSQRIPTGKAFPNTKVFLLDGKNNLITQSGVEGEICVTGNTLSLGYYNNNDATKKSFVQNPLVPYSETIYKTGDLAYYDQNANIVWSCRKDFQIKHMGYRIELSEIEICINTLDYIEECCCAYDNKNDSIVLFYTSARDCRKEIGKHVRSRLPKYMYPSKYIRLDSMPHNANGKIDRKKLKEII